MVKWLSVFSLAAMLPAAGVGCAPYHMAHHHGMRPFAVCDPGNCPGTCGAMAPRSRQASYGCGDCDPCDPCGPCYYGEYSPFGPLAAVFRIFRPVTWMGPACGDRYWGDSLSYPPDCCDPCDCYGNYTGMQVANCPRRGRGRECGACVESACVADCADCGCGPGQVEDAHCESCTGLVGQRIQGMPARQQAVYPPRQSPVQRQVVSRMPQGPVQQPGTYRVLGTAAERQAAYRVYDAPSQPRAAQRTQPVVVR